ncbi:MAG: hypothetical protein Q8936_00140 [Bacillota bacterium]|nr:hypothetical protein [Bacillota bacterium]
MNKKLALMVTAVAVGGTMLAGTAATVMAQSSGYDIYKAAVLNIPTIKDATAKADITVTDNGSVILTANDQTKFNKNNNTTSSLNDVKYGTKELKTESYVQDGKMINKTSDSDVYTVMERGQGKRVEKKAGSEDNQIKQGFQGIIDAYVGSRSDDFTATSNSDGTKTVNIKLDESQITPLDNAIVSFAVKAAGSGEFRNKQEGISADLKAVIPQLTSDITVKAIDANALIDSKNEIENQTTNITISGKDADGKVHNIVITAKIALSDIDNTTPDKVDLTGKQIKTVTPQDFKRAK